MKFSRSKALRFVAFLREFRFAIHYAVQLPNVFVFDFGLECQRKRVRKAKEGFFLPIPRSEFLYGKKNGSFDSNPRRLFNMLLSSS